MCPNQIPKLIREGYRRTSRAHGLVSRIDRPDWLDVIRCSFSPTSRPLDPNCCWESYYRRVLSKDTIELPRRQALLVPASDWDFIGYIPKEGDLVMPVGKDKVGHGPP